MRKPWLWIAGLAGVAVIAVVAWFAGEWIATQIVTSTVRQQVIEQLALPADQQVDVTVQEPVIPQLVKGSIDAITVSSPDVPIESFSGDVTVHATGVPIRGDGDVQSATATVSMDQKQLQGLLSTVDGFPADSVGLADPNVTMSKDVSFLGASIPLGIGLTPSAKNGELVLTPDYVKVGGAQLSAADVERRFGTAADAVLHDYPVCIAKYLPVGMKLAHVAVTGDQLVAHFDIDGAIIHDKTLQQKGTCA
ncbi:LmeA family phospholipid-binding protein [Microbacterium rhizosphaerae]|uniref:DUF2993 domain-containing protein n=1 Tax=Microbacterium rhizosphaerae TaxID=1678237 RepID=A0ABZ0SUC1_9MICO|nr:DUF2993 domain-containing protein [Microbacterium rhizosphaerae]WPR90976.1 DUF2993 domain-containing protein [Microbacterium rhizosphaerae]